MDFLRWLAQCVNCKYLSKRPRILFPHKVQFNRHGKQQGGKVGNSQVEQVDVGGGPHILIPHDHEARCKVSEHTKN